ncbi:MAG: STAS domain-containing protein [Pseudomonadota bacterium]|nr:STAS domain-containing protein [Pseudomonadota bacterium]
MKLPEDAGLEVAPALAEQMAQSLAESSGTWQIDASALKAFDSSTIALLLHARRLAEKAKREIALFGVPAQLDRLAQLYGIEGLLPLADEAIAASPASTSPTSPVAT